MKSTSLRPNILWICTDQQRYDTIGVLGNPYLRTPHIDRLAAEGVACTRCYSQSPVCTPSRASFLTGRYPNNLGVQRNGNASFPAGIELITHRLADQGYDCGLSGKLHLSACDGRVEQRPDDGYRVFHWSHHPHPEPCWPNASHDYQRWLAEQGIAWDEVYTGEMAAQHAQSGFVAGVPAAYHQTTWCANEAIAFMREPRQGPWLMSVNPFDPHPPFDPPAEYLERINAGSLPLPLFGPEDAERQTVFGRGIAHQTRDPQSPDTYDARQMVAAYYAQIELIDDQVGRMLAALEETGQRENTIVIFTSDHGEMLGDHGLRLKGCRFYEGAVHVPLIISWPGHFAAGVRADALVELVDLAPTLYAATGVAAPPETQGKSLLPILTGQASPHLHKAFARCEYHDALNQPIASHADMIFDGRYKLVVYHGTGLGELYDLQADPEEYTNLWDDPGTAQMRCLLTVALFDAVSQTTDLGTPRIGRF